MNTKLTLRLDEDLIKSAKAYAARSGKSLSQLVEAYFFMLDKNATPKIKELPPIVKGLKGALKNADIDESDYKKYLEDKYL
jgi:hypothetical protein